MLMAALVALKPAVPLMSRAVLAAWVILPAALTERLPLATLALPRPRALLLCRLTLTAALVAVKLAAPLTLRAVLAAWLMLPAAVTDRAPLLTAMLPRLSALLLVRAALPVALVVRLTVPLKALAALARLMAPLVAVK